jgi:hypothetical protein
MKPKLARRKFRHSMNAVEDPARPLRRPIRTTAEDTNCVRPGMRRVPESRSFSGFVELGGGFDSRRLHFVTGCDIQCQGLPPKRLYPCYGEVFFV